MNLRKMALLSLAAMFLISGCSNTGSAEKTAPATSPTQGQAADFSLENTDNRTVRLSDYQDKVIILNFFATWCPPCRAEIPDFVELVKDYGDKGLVILGVSVDRGAAAAVKEFVKQYDINYPVMLDDGLVSKTYGPIHSIPTTFIIDRNKNIVQKIIGSRNKDYFENIIKPLL